MVNINIPEDKKEIITAFKALVNAFKNDIKDSNFSSYEQGTNQGEQKKEDDFNIMDYAGIIKTDISDDIKKIKLNDKEYRTKYGMVQ